MPRLNKELMRSAIKKTTRETKQTKLSKTKKLTAKFQYLNVRAPSKQRQNAIR